MAKPHFVGLIGKPGARLPAGMDTVAKSSLGRIVVTRIEAAIRCFDLWQGVKGPISYMYKSLLGHGVWTHLILQTHLKISLWRFRGQLTWDLGVKVVQPFYTNFKFFPQWRSFCVFHSSICYSVYYSTKSNHFYAFQSGGLAVWRRISLVGLRVSNMANTLFSSSSSFGNGKRAAQRLRSFDDWLDWQHSYGCVVRCSKSLVDKSEVN